MPNPNKKRSSGKGERPMKAFVRLIACVLVLPTLLLFLPRTALCAGKESSAKSGNKTITRHEPKVMASPEQVMTPEQAAQVKKKKTPWLWIGLGAVVVIGLAAAIGGGGGGGSSSDPDPQPEEGDITVEW
jgi:hypothetical protein